MTARTTADRIRNIAKFIAAENGTQYASLRIIREALADIPRAELDAEMTRLYTAGHVDLVPQSCQSNLTLADREAAVRVGGEDKHRLAWAA